VNVLAGPATAAAVLLVVGGASKVVRPGNTTRALVALRLPGHPAAVRLLATAEMGIGVAAVASGGRLAWSLVAASYLGFAGFVLLAMSREGAASSCGCFGAPGTPPTAAHVLITLAASGVAFATALGPQPGPLHDALRDQPLMGLPFVVLTGCCVWFAYAALAVLPRTSQYAARGRRG
jgi:hypothetical protein